MTRRFPVPALAFVALLSLAGCAEQPIDGGAPAPTPTAATPAVPVTAPAAATPRVSRRKGDERPEFYVVQRGDTLFGIALDFGFDYRDLSQWNGLSDPGRILVGQRLRLTPPPASATPADGLEVRARSGPPDLQPEALPGTPLPAPDTAPAPTPVPEAAIPRLSEPRAQTVPYSAQTLAQWQKGSGSDKDKAVPEPKPAAEAKSKDGKPVPAVVPPAPGTPAAKEAAGKEAVATKEKETPGKDAPAKDAVPKESAAKAAAERDEDDESLEWTWPVRGDLLYRFGDSGRLKGVGIGGRVGQPVAAAASGKVVYAGSGLRGYGRMVIVKHNETYLSVYAHNNALLVKEGDGVKRGQKIAEMGDSDAPRVGLHFEVRRFGRPIDPLGRLPAP